MRRPTGFCGTIVQHESPGEHLSALVKAPCRRASVGLVPSHVAGPHVPAVPALAFCPRTWHGRVRPILLAPSLFLRAIARIYAASKRRMDGIVEKGRPQLKV